MADKITMGNLIVSPLDEDKLLQEIHSLEEENRDESPAIIPVRGDPGWSDYVLSQFQDNEVVIQKDANQHETGRFPKVNGLRRLGEVLVGDVLESCATPINVIISDNSAVCTFTYKIKFLGKDGKERFFSDVGEVLYFEGDSKLNNVGDGRFAKFPSSIAATRAEARTYRKALMLNAVAWEELDKRDLKGKEGNNDQPDVISKDQIIMITNLCKRLKIDLAKYLQTYQRDNLNKISYFEAVSMVKQLDGFQRDKKGLEKYIAAFAVNS